MSTLIYPSVERLIKRCRKLKVYDSCEVELTLAINIANEIDGLTAEGAVNASLYQQMRLLTGQVKMTIANATKNDNTGDLDDLIDDLTNGG